MSLKKRISPRIALTIVIVIPLVAGGWWRLTHRAEDIAIVKADPDAQKVAAANTKFTFRLLKDLDGHRAPDKPNVIISPFCISTNLSMVLAGAP
ncbi:MAG: serpin family protein [Capsulimonadaceae bacterium]